jgi:hypothetical protein
MEHSKGMSEAFVPISSIELRSTALEKQKRQVEIGQEA